MRGMANPITPKLNRKTVEAGMITPSAIAALCHSPEASTPATITATCIIATRTAFLIEYMTENVV